MRRLVIAGGLAVVLACESRAPAGGTEGPRAAGVDFSKREMVIDRLAEPRRLPVAVGSRPGPETIATSDASVVSILADGRVVAHRNGVAVLSVRGGSGADLHVLVRAVGALAVEPAALTLRPGNETRLRLLADGGMEVPGEAVEWTTDAPSAVLVRGGRLKVFAPGVHVVRARYGGAEATTRVTVSVGGQGLRVNPAHALLHRGEVAVFLAETGQVGTRAEWTSSRPSVLRAAGDGLFEAVGAGRARACARAMGLEGCADVEVRR
jgi:hypothetical protein